MRHGSCVVAAAAAAIAHAGTAAVTAMAAAVAYATAAALLQPRLQLEPVARAPGQLHPQPWQQPLQHAAVIARATATAATGTAAAIGRVACAAAAIVTVAAAAVVLHAP